MKALKQTVRHYYKYIDSAFVQPVLSANGLLGRSSFAVAGAGYVYDAWYAFDNNSSTHANMTNESGYGTYSDCLIIYNPNALNITAIALNQYISTQYNTYSVIKNGTVYGSNDGATWTTLAVFTGTQTADYTINLSSNTGFYKYYKIKMTDSYYLYSGHYYWYVNTCTLTATERAISESTSSDYDFYKDVDEYSCYKSGADYYAFNI